MRSTLKTGNQFLAITRYPLARELAENVKEIIVMAI